MDTKKRKYVVYGLKNQYEEIVYIGQTVQDVEKRFKQHKNQINKYKKYVEANEKTKKSSKIQKFYKTCYENEWELQMFIISEYDSRKESLMWEAWNILNEKLVLNNEKLQNKLIDKIYV